MSHARISQLREYGMWTAFFVGIDVHHVHKKVSQRLFCYNLKNC